MKQIPNIEETRESVKKVLKEYYGYKSEQDVPDGLAAVLEDWLHQQLQKAREEERERNVKLINNIIQQSSDDSSDSWFNALRCARETIAHHSELDQDKK